MIFVKDLSVRGSHWVIQRPSERSWRSLMLADVLVLLLSGLVWGQVSVNVQTSQVRAIMPWEGLGIHTSVYYNQFGNPALPGRIQEAGLTTLRYPGGGYADVFHWSITRASWENGITGGGLSPWWGEPGNFGYVGPGSDFAGFVRLLDKLPGSQAVITVNYGSAMKLVGGQSAVPDYGGQPQEAAAWVAYANGDPSLFGTPNDIVLGVDQQGNNWKTVGYWAKLRASTPTEYQQWATAAGLYDPLNAFLAIGRPQPIGIKYWEIGNETFGTGYYDSGGSNGYSVNYDVPYPYTTYPRYGNPNLSPAHYGQEVNQYAQWMKMVDPTIKIGAVLSTPPDDWSWDGYNGQHWNPEVLAQCAANIDFVVVHWYPWAGNNANGDALLSYPASKIPVMINGTTPGLDSGANAGVRDWLAIYGNPNAEIMVTEFGYMGSLSSTVRTAAEAIFVADSYLTWLENGVLSVQYLELLTKNFLSDASGLTPGSAFYAVQMVHKMVEPGDAFVQASSGSSTLRVHAAVQEDGTVAVMLMNLSRTSAQTANVVIDGVALLDQVLRLSTTGSGITQTTLTVSPGSNPGNVFSVSVPTRTVYLFLLQPTIPGDLDGDGDVDDADLTLLLNRWGQSLARYQGNLDGQGVIDDFDLNILLSNWGRSGSGTGVPEPASLGLIGPLVLLWFWRRQRMGS